jgi:molybdopterin-guanine dinucleotide biosynthesis protein A
MGRDKAWLQLGGRAMIEWVISAIKPVTTSLAILANDPAYARLGLPVIADETPDSGPLEAIRQALALASVSPAVVVACDLPFVTSELLTYLVECLDEYDAVVPVAQDGRVQPHCAVYSKSAFETASKLVAARDLKMSHLLDRLSTRYVSFKEISFLPGVDSFFENINTTGDLMRARERLGRT